MTVSFYGTNMLIAETVVKKAICALLIYMSLAGKSIIKWMCSMMVNLIITCGATVAWGQENKTLTQTAFRKNTEI